MLGKKDWEAIDKEAEEYHALCKLRDKDEAQAELTTLRAELAKANEENKRLRDALHALVRTLWIGGPHSSDVINFDAYEQAKEALK